MGPDSAAALPGDNQARERLRRHLDAEGVLLDLHGDACRFGFGIEQLHDRLLIGADERDPISIISFAFD
jgi:hypothetical protein